MGLPRLPWRRCSTARSRWSGSTSAAAGARPADGGPFTIEQAVDDLDQVRAALGFDRWAVAGHSWGAELALRYAARHPDRTIAVAYIAGVGAGNGFREAFAPSRTVVSAPTASAWAALSAIPAADLTPAEEREMCLLQWRTDFSPGPDAAGRALALWETRPPGGDDQHGRQPSSCGATVRPRISAWPPPASPAR